ncbi:hypothetical protein ACROYT_G032696 [Oculina patagonica]
MVDPETKQSPSWKVTPKSVETAIEGRNKTLYCFAVGRPAPKIIWKKNGQQIIKGRNSFEIPDAFFGRRLDIVNVKKDAHEDTYTCEAENSENSGRPNIYSMRLEVKVAPHWRGKQPPPDKQIIDIQGNGTLLCDAIGDPAPSFLWYKDGKRLTSSTPQRKIENNKLVFKNVGLEEDGMYQCVAESSLGMIVSSTWINVRAKPPTFSVFGPFYLFEDSEGRLKCEPDAAPPPTFKWYFTPKGGAESQITIGQAGYRILSDGTLVIDKVTKQDAGQYRCWAKNFLNFTQATAEATVLQKTTIVVPPKDRTVKEGNNVDLTCRATYDPTLEIGYFWKRDDATIVYNSKIKWDQWKNVLTISDIRVEDAGVYTCVAYTPDPKRSEDTASAIINIQGVPFPPTSLGITEDTCWNRTTTLTWVTTASNDAPIMHFLVEQESDHEPNVFKFIYNVTNPNATSVTFNLTGWASLRFRMRAVNRFGPSRPSEATAAGSCRTSQGAPDKFPDNFRGVPKKAEELDIAWTPMPRVDWNAPGLYYILNYRRAGGEPPAKWEEERITNASIGVFPVPDPGYYKLWEFKIQAGNNIGLGPPSAIEQSYSGQDAPEGAPEDVSTGEITARSVQLSWKPVAPTKGGSVDGYRIYYWGESRLTARRRRRAIPSYAKSTNVTGGNTKETTVYGLTPYTNYRIAITAFNSGGNGPASDEVTAATLEAVPGPPSDVEVYAFAEYILVTWEKPTEPNGVITNYRVGSAEFPGSEPQGVVVDEKTELESDARRYLLSNQKELTDYVVETQAKTSPGWGESVRKTTRTVKMSAPAKPEKPTVVGTKVDSVKVTYNFGLGGGYTHEFRVMYRKKLPDEEFVNTSWVDHFDTQDTEISGLDPDLYQFRTVGRNKLGESPPSDITEARPLPGVSAGQRATTPIHKSAWFIALLVLIALLFLVLIIFVLYTKHRGAKYPVGKRERKRAALIDREPFDEEEGPFNGGAQENPPPYPSQGSLEKRSRDSDRDSLDDYGEGPQFNEDGSFIEEYGDEKKAPPDEKDQSAFATFV